VDTILKRMEDNRQDLIVIVAGYTELMEEFINSNPGLESRFNKYIFFKDYTGAELYQIFLSMCKKQEYEPDNKAKKYVKEYLEHLKQRGIKMAIATANDDKFYMPCLKRNNILEYFDYIFDVNEFKGSKNDPKIYLHAASKLNLNPSEIAVFEDIPNAIRSAKDGGFYVVAVDDLNEIGLRDEKKELADMFISSFSELL
jgi:HAD superfamily hydrolase (TIGR01509 family)